MNTRLRDYHSRDKNDARVIHCTSHFTPLSPNKHHNQRHHVKHLSFLLQLQTAYRILSDLDKIFKQNMAKEFQDKVVLVTGAASGIGYGTPPTSPTPLLSSLVIYGQANT